MVEPEATSSSRLNHRPQSFPRKPPMTASPALSPTVSPDRETSLLASVPTGLLIGGEWRDASDGGTFDVHDPATGEVLATLASATSADAIAALDAADAA